MIGDILFLGHNDPAQCYRKVSKLPKLVLFIVLNHSSFPCKDKSLSINALWRCCAVHTSSRASRAL